MTIGVSNGVMEVTEYECVFRRGKPQDYISIHTPVKYPEKYTMNSPKVKELLKWYNETFIDDDVRHWMKKYHASTIRGGNPDKLFVVHSGDTNNSKSMWKKAVDCVYGPYAVDIPMSVLVGGQNKSGPSPETAQLKGTRLGSLSEPDDSTQLENGITKMLSGGDDFFARGCNENGGKIKNTFKLSMYANKIPRFSSSDKAIYERLVNVEYKTTWVKTGAPETEAERYAQRLFPQDRFFDDKIPTMAPAALWLWAYYYKIYAKEGLTDLPQEILASTQNYWNNNDDYKMFINEKIQYVFTDETKTVRDKNAKITLQEVFNRFTTWFREIHPSVKCPDRATVKIHFNNICKKHSITEGVWYGMQFIEYED